MAAPDNSSEPRSIGRYQVLSLLGSGAMGRVLLAEDPRIKRRLAIKVLRMDSLRDPAERHETLLRFQREAEVSGLLNHPGIVAIYDVGEEPDLGPFLAMEFVPGRPLDSLIKDGPALGIPEKLLIAAGLASALDHAHAKGIIHRDVKPGNVMIGEDGRPKLMDFGIARRDNAELTQAGTFLGTPSYASPEQIREGTTDARSDLFSLGVLVFELLSGQSPFPGTSINTILYRIVNEPPVEIQPPVTGILPEGWKRVFDRVLAKRPEERHASCEAFVRDLAEAVVDLGAGHREAAPPRVQPDEDSPRTEINPETLDAVRTLPSRPRRKVWPWLAALLLVAGSAGGWYALKVPRKAHFQIETTPPGATLTVNGQPAGGTPSRQTLASGDRLRLELKGFQPITYDVKAGATPAPFVLAPIVTEETLDSVPPGATVVLDEKPLPGVTPMRVSWNQGLPHRLTLTLDKLGHASDFAPGEVPGGRIFALKEGGTATSQPEPALDPTAPGSLRLTGGFSVRLRADGKDLGELAPGAKVSLPPGLHRLELSSTAHFYRDSRTLSVTAGQAATLTVPALATITVESYPGTGKVFVDGQDTGIESDGSSLQLAHGRHTLTVRGPKGIHTETLDLSGNRALRFPL